MKAKRKALVVSSLVFLDWLGQYFGYRFGFGIFNDGVSFGIWPGITPWLILLVWILIFLKFEKSLSLILWGGVGNLLPRLVFGGVWDYIPIYFFGLWVNISDLMISMGVFSYILGINGDSGSIRGREDTGDKQAGGARGKQS